MWTLATKWNENWDSIENLNGGGQGSVKKVRHKSKNNVGFLKILNRQTDAERRARFFREAVAYETTSHWGIPKLIESNAEKHEDPEYKLYLVTEFISGQTLTEFVQASGPLSGIDACKITEKLLQIVEHFHINDWVHRDIKPDNIIVRDGASDGVILVDFGLAYKDGLTTNFATPDSEEVGNRFLRLPELRADSPMKQDIRSDLSFVGAILYYLVTGSAPVVLRDEQGKLPHQRLAAIKNIRAAFPSNNLKAFGFFDRVFSERIYKRFESNEMMKQGLKELMTKKTNIVNDTNDELDTIVDALNNAANRQLVENNKVYGLAMQQIEAIHRELSLSFSPAYNRFQRGHVNSSDGLRNTLGFSHFVDKNNKFSLTFLIQIIGTEVVTHINGSSVHRTDAKEPLFGEEFIRIIKNYFIKGMKELVKNNPM